MLKGLNSYIKEIKNKINEDYLSPLFIRLANLYYHDGQYEESINVCNIGLKIYPEYYTAKLLLLKSLIKLEYMSEAEPVLIELEEKFPNLDVIKNFRKEINNMKKANKQEKIYYSNKINSYLEYKNYTRKIYNILPETQYDIQNLQRILDDLNKESVDEHYSEDEFVTFRNRFNDMQLERERIVKRPVSAGKERKTTGSTESFFSQIKIITETLADLLAKQGYFKEAFEAYNILLNTQGINKARIQEKLYDLERNF
jgi:tetratricopeptide (TPR) repeat protein